MIAVGPKQMVVYMNGIGRAFSSHWQGEVYPTWLELCCLSNILIYQTRLIKLLTSIVSAHAVSFAAADAKSTAGGFLFVYVILSIIISYYHYFL